MHIKKGKITESQERGATTELDVVIAMPAFNEALAIPAFVSEISEAFAGTNFLIVVVNDHSTDDTENTLRTLATTYPLQFHTNAQNSGHGPSTLKALSLAAGFSPKYVVATDGDGHIAGQVLRRLYDGAWSSKTLTVIEGARTQRDDPWFRKIASAATRFLVKHFSTIPPEDANTPFRVYPTKILRELLTKITADHLTPNLVMATLVRRDGIPFSVIPVAQHKREGTVDNGSTWKQRFRLVPSRRFLHFCVKATVQWLLPGRPLK